MSPLGAIAIIGLAAGLVYVVSANNVGAAGSACGSMTGDDLTNCLAANPQAACQYAAFPGNVACSLGISSTTLYIGAAAAGLLTLWAVMR